MKKIMTYTLAVTALISLFSCGDNRKPGKVYMPDMAYSRAYETYAERDSAIFTENPAERGNKIYYNAAPVEGTIKQGDLFPYTISNDSAGYTKSASVPNPYDTIKMGETELKEMARLYNINCAICHGDKGAGNGPLSTSGKIGGVANLTLDTYVKMTDGTMFHSITYGKNLMGSYASQLSREQRWKIVKYIRTLQPKATAAAPATDTTKKNGIK
jgi:mono/diheme cytochrome c family protein